MNRFLLATASFLLTSVIAQAAPSVRGLAGTASNDQTVVISGTGFGSNNLRQEWLGGTTGVIDAQAVGTRFDQLGRTGWSLMQPSTPTYPRVNAERSWSNGKSLVFDTRGTTEYKQTLFYDTGAAGYTNLYTNALIYLDHDTLMSGSYLQWKIMRWYKVADVLDHINNLSGAYMSNPMGSGHVGVFTGWNTDQGQYVYWFNTDGRQNLPGRGAWYRYETWLRMNSSPGTADGRFRVRVTNPNTGAVVTDNTINNMVFNGRGDTGNFRYLVLQNYFGNASDGGYSQADNAHGVAWWDDIYVSQSEARVEVCSQSTYAACTSREIQPASAWSDTSSSVKLNRGNKSDMASTYLYVVDSTGAVNSQGYRVEAGAVKAPDVPTNVRAQ
jgi:hypothetical protein